MPHLKINETVSIHCNVVHNDNQHDSRIFYTFIANKYSGLFLDISPKQKIFISI